MLARILWSSVDAVETDDELVEHFSTLVATADLDRDRARDWVVFRTIDYWLWGLSVGLTEDPVRCHQVLRLFL